MQKEAASLILSGIKVMAKLSFLKRTSISGLINISLSADEKRTQMACEAKETQRHSIWNKKQSQQKIEMKQSS